MKNILIETGKNEDLVWTQVATDLSSDDVLDYQLLITENDAQVSLIIDVDLGGGFEGGYASTALSALLPHHTTFRFAIHREHFIDEIGKFLGMQDITTGYAEFDKKIVVKSNRSEEVKYLFADEEVRRILSDLDNFSFGIHTHSVSGEKEPFLELIIDDAVTDIGQLRALYTIFKKVLATLKSIPAEDSVSYSKGI